MTTMKVVHTEVKANFAGTKRTWTISQFNWLDGKVGYKTEMVMGRPEYITVTLAEAHVWLAAR